MDLANALDVDQTPDLEKHARQFIVMARDRSGFSDKGEADLHKMFVANVIDSQHKLDPYSLVYYYIDKVVDGNARRMYQNKIANYRILDRFSDGNEYRALTHAPEYIEFVEKLQGLNPIASANLFSTYARKKYNHIMRYRSCRVGEIPLYPRHLTENGEGHIPKKQERKWQKKWGEVVKFFEYHAELVGVFDKIIEPIHAIEWAFKDRSPTFGDAVKFAGAAYYALYIIRLLIYLPI
jgi:hypothetical protein